MRGQVQPGALMSARRTRRRHWWRELIVDAFRCADEAWRLQAEAVALGYATELDEYAAAHPRPTLKGFMLALAGSTRPAIESETA